jgi:hypothetical protein
MYFVLRVAITLNIVVVALAVAAVYHVCMYVIRSENGDAEMRVEKLKGHQF